MKKNDTSGSTPVSGRSHRLHATRHATRNVRSIATLGAVTALFFAAVPLTSASSVSNLTTPSIGATDASDTAGKDRRGSGQKSSKSYRGQSRPKANRSRPNRSSANKSRSNGSRGNKARSNNSRSNRSSANRSQPNRSNANRSNPNRSRANRSQQNRSRSGAARSNNSRESKARPATRSGSQHRATRRDTGSGSGSQGKAAHPSSRQQATSRSSNRNNARHDRSQSGKASANKNNRSNRSARSRGRDNLSSRSSADRTAKRSEKSKHQYDKRRPIASGGDNDDFVSAARPDYGSSYERNKARGDRPDYGSSYERAKSRERDRRRPAATHDYDDGYNHGKKGGHKGKKGHKGSDGKKGHGDYSDGYDDHYDDGKGHNYNNGPHGKQKKHKTVNNYYYGNGYGHGGYYNSWWDPHYFSYPYYGIGYSSYYDGLYFSLGFGGSYWNDWYGSRRYYGSYYDNNNTIVVIDDNEPEKIYVPIETNRRTPDFTVGWEHLATGRDEEALQYFSNRVSRWGSSSSAKAGYALAAAQMQDRSRAVWSMRRAFRIDNGDLGYLPLDTRLRRLAELLESRYAYDAENSSGRERRDALFMSAALRYILHEPEAALDAAYAAQDAGDRDSSLNALIRSAEADLDY